MKFIISYTILSVFIGLFQIFDGVFLSINVLWPITKVFAVFEFLWVFFSIFAIYKFNKEKINSLIPITYVVYNMFGWCYGVYITFQNQNKGTIDIPLWFAIFGACYGGLFAIMNFKKLQLLRNIGKDKIVVSSSIVNK